jgi:hypothetical protein
MTNPSRPIPQVEAIEITLHYEPPPTIEFDITGDTSVEDRKILIHRWRDEPDYPYPSRFQRLLPGLNNADRDRKIQIGGTLKSATGVPLAGHAIYLRITDPADDAPYIPETKRLPGDNGSWLGAILEPPVVTTDNNGRFMAVLTGSEIAGDNYRIEASTIPNFNFSSACGLANNCVRSGVLTNWKRVYVEYDRMFRVGGMIMTPALAGQNRVEISYNKKFKKNHTVRLIHAPRIGEPATNFYTEDAVIIDTIRNQSANTLTLVLDQPLGRNYYPSQTSDDQLGDAAGFITFDDEEDFYNLRDPVNDYTPPLFAAAFVEYSYLSSHFDPVPYLPYAKEVHDIGGLADHWFINRIPGTNGKLVASPNHQHLLAGSTEISQNVEGRTGAAGGTNFSWLWVDRIEASGHANAAQWRNIGENTAHEIGHQWHINQDKVPAFGSEHCDPYKQYDSTVLFCTMHSTADASEFNDGRVAFHYMANGDVDSEYVFIRRRPEPIPLP